MIDLKNKENCSNILLHQLADGEPLESVYVKTLKSHYCDVISSKVSGRYESMLTSMQPDLDKYDRRINAAVIEYEKKNNIFVSQFIETPKHPSDPLVVCIDIDYVDSNTWYHVILALTENEYGRGITKFGTPKCFNPRAQRVDHAAIFNATRQTFI